MMPPPGFGAVSSPSSPGGSSTIVGAPGCGCSWRGGTCASATVLHFKVLMTFEVGLAVGDQLFEAILVDGREGSR